MKRFVVGTFLLSTIASFGVAEAQSHQSKNITVYKSPTCGCCGKWEDHLKKNGFKVTSKPTEDMQTVKTQNKIPSDKASCHTGVIGGYAIEGHVPASTIKRLLKERPKDVAGLTVPGMPLGSPGMEAPGEHPKYQVLAIKKDGSTIVYSEEAPLK